MKITEAEEVSHAGLHGLRKQVRDAKRETLETGSGGKPGISCHCLLLLWLQVSWEPLELRRKKAKTGA